MPNRFDVIVIGVGAMGASACFHLASRGVAVLGIEQFDIPHALGSSHGFSRMIRTAYYEQPLYVPLLQRAYVLWDELEVMTGRRLLHRVGGLYMGPTDGILIDGAVKSAGAHQLDHQILSAEELRSRFPQFVIPQDWLGFFDVAAGFLLPELVIGSYAELAMRRGAVIRARESVRSWKADQRHVTVTTDRGEYHADQLIFCSGAWTGKLLQELPISLTVTRQVLAWVWPKTPALFELGKLPVWAIDSLDGGIYYGFPMIPEVPGFKLAHHITGPIADPETLNRQATAGDETGIRAALKKHIPHADGPLTALRICMYTNTPDRDFIIDYHPEYPRVQIAAGFSGHGFKFASVVGEILADRATSGQTRWDLEFLSIANRRMTR